MAIKAFRINTYRKQGVLFSQKSPRPIARPVLEGRPEDIPAPSGASFSPQHQHPTYVRW
jgi:hypothetical protein